MNREDQTDQLQHVRSFDVSSSYLYQGNLNMPPVVVAIDSREEPWLDKMLGGLCFGFFVLTWISSLASPFLFVFSATYGGFYYLFAASIALTTLAAYVPWKKGKLSLWLQRVISSKTPCHFRSASMVFEGASLPKPTDPQTFYAVHPHGAYCIGWAMLFCNPVLQHVRFCFAPALYASPFFRLFARITGNPGSAAKFDMVRHMRTGESLALPPGGFEEATLTSTAKDRVFIRKRTGFIRLCLQHGIQVRPVYVFGEKSCYWNVQGMFPARLALNRYGIPAIFPWGNLVFPLIPKAAVDLRIVVGAPLVLPRIDNPTKDQVKQWHDKYVASLVKLFDDHKEDAYGAEQGKIQKLEVW